MTAPTRPTTKPKSQPKCSNDSWSARPVPLFCWAHGGRQRVSNTVWWTDTVHEGKKNWSAVRETSTCTPSAPYRSPRILGILISDKQLAATRLKMDIFQVIQRLILWKLWMWRREGDGDGNGEPDTPDEMLNISMGCISRVQLGKSQWKTFEKGGLVFKGPILSH